MARLRPPQAAIPSVDRLISTPAFADVLEAHGRARVVGALRAELAEIRARVSADKTAPVDAEDLIAARVDARVRSADEPSLRRVFNLTGVILHTNLGRAVMPQEAADAMAQAAVSAVNVELDLATGQRGERDDHLEPLLRELTGAEAATVVNNNAAAVLLVLNTLAQRREAPLSRGEMIEIGGGFRIPEVMKRAGCKLVEVGTTNRTRLADYQAAIGPRTALLLKVHPSNYEIRGFTESVSEEKLAGLAHKHNLPLVSDLGSGALVDMRRWKLPYEPTVHATIEAGVDVVTFSGDKLLGGLQAGFIAGRRDLIDQIRRNPLKRALRLDKVAIAGLEAVLRLYRDPDHLAERLPVLRTMTRPVAELEEIAARLRPAVAAAIGGRADVTIESCASQIGSGSLPSSAIESRALVLHPRSPRKRDAAKAAADLAAAFRKLPVPVVGRVNDGALVLDLRCLDDEAGFARQLSRLAP